MSHHVLLHPCQYQTLRHLNTEMLSGFWGIAADCFSIEINSGKWIHHIYKVSPLNSTLVLCSRVTAASEELQSTLIHKQLAVWPPLTSTTQYIMIYDCLCFICIYSMIHWTEVGPQKIYFSSESNPWTLKDQDQSKKILILESECVFLHDCWLICLFPFL